jgi:hypothetical protein
MFALLALVSAAAFVAAGCCLVRTWCATDDWHISSWNPSARTLIATQVGIRRGGIILHWERTKALPSDNVLAIVAAVGPANRRVVHRVWPGNSGAEGPWLWGDHYRATPGVGINASGLSDRWTLQFRVETMLILFAIVPGLWTITSLRRWRRNRASGPRGFAVVVPKVDASPAA